MGMLAMLSTEVASGLDFDFSDALTTALTNISSGFGKYVLIAIPIGLAIWGAPKGIQLVKKFFNALTH